MRGILTYMHVQLEEDFAQGSQGLGNEYECDKTLI